MSEHQSKPKVLFVLGGPGSGKGTVCEGLVKNFHFKHFSTGDLLREEVKKGSELGKQIDGFISKGEMVPGDVTVTLIKTAIFESAATNPLFLLDGYPRNQSNIDYWRQVMRDDVEVLGILYLNCAEETMKARILSRGQSSGRSDDNEEIFKNRIKVFFSETVPAIEAWKRDGGKVFDISSESTKEECYEEASKVIKQMELDRPDVSEIKQYVKTKVDPFIKPLIVFLMKNKPDNVYSSIQYWMSTEGEAIRKNLDKK